jgi:hypothetical protein
VLGATLVTDDGDLLGDDIVRLIVDNCPLKSVRRGAR